MVVQVLAVPSFFMMPILGEPRLVSMIRHFARRRCVLGGEEEVGGEGKEDGEVATLIQTNGGLLPERV